MSIVRVLVADDHDRVREGVRALIAAQPAMEVVAVVSNGREAVQSGHQHQPNLVVMDVSMPQLDGVEATRQIRRLCPNIRVLALSANEDWRSVERMLEAGAAGYLLKRSAPGSLIVALEAVLAGKQYLDPALQPPPAPPSVEEPDTSEAVKLSHDERAVLELVAEGNPNREIALRLGISVQDVEATRAQGMGKLGLRDRAGLVRYAVRQGWLNE